MCSFAKEGKGAQLPLRASSIIKISLEFQNDCARRDVSVSGAQGERVRKGPLSAGGISLSVRLL